MDRAAHTHTHTHSCTHSLGTQPTVPIGLESHLRLQQLQPGRPVSSGLSVSAIWVLFAFGAGPGQTTQYTTVFGEGREGKRIKQRALVSIKTNQFE